VQFERYPLSTAQSKTFVIKKITHWLCSGDLSCNYYNRYVKDESSNTMYTCDMEHLVLERGLEHLFKEDLE
jgi:hypothetical protein